MKKIAIMFFLLAIAIAVPVSAAIPATRSVRATYAFAVTGAALDVDLTAVHNIKVTQVHFNLSDVIAVDEPIYIRRLSSTAKVLSVRRIDPVGTISSANFTQTFDSFVLEAGDVVAIDWANTGALNVLAGSNSTYELD